MKNLKDLLKNNLPKSSPVVMVHEIAIVGGYHVLSVPVMSDTITCLVCGGSVCFCPVKEPAINPVYRVWICANSLCLTTDLKNISKATTIPPKSKQALLWASFCEINGIGDVHHDVKFESIEQSDKMIKAMRDFALHPFGIIYFQGGSGNGKTYAAMAICEFYTRNRSSCIFMTMRQMMSKWLDSSKEVLSGNFVNRMNSTELLVIDDFGTAEVPPGFMSFFLDVINTRLQWKNRGTIITTNLDDEKFSKISGEALADRVFTGTMFAFTKASKRKKTIK